MTREEEKSLVERVINGEEDAIRLFYEINKNVLYSTIHKFYFAREYGVDDYYQEFMLRLIEDDWRRLRMWRGDSKLSSYLVTMLRNFLMDEYRKSRPMEDENGLETIGEDPSDDIEDTIYIDTLRPYFQECLKSLSERDHEIINRAFIKDESVDEIADALGITEATYYTALHRAKKRLVERIKEEYPFLFEDDE